MRFTYSTDIPRRISLFLGNTLYAVAFGYYTVICFLGYNGTRALPDLDYLANTFDSSTIPTSH